jgi:drug/metabolite transporter (DMT)-like permease
MVRRYVPLLVLLALIWGASFLFIKVGLRDFAPVVVAWLRLVIAAVLLLGLLVVQTGARAAVAEVRGAGREVIGLGLVQNAIPFVLISWGETHIDSGVAAIGNASVPIFVALLAFRYARGERSTGMRLGGVVLGIVGVAVLAGVSPRGGWLGAVGTLAVVVASFSYAIGGLWIQRMLRTTRPLPLTVASLGSGALVLTPFALVSLPSHAPGGKALLSVVALGVFGTAVAMVLFFSLIAMAGAAKASLVTYLQPVFAVIYGVVLLSEPFRWPELVGMVLILGGVAFGSGTLALRRRGRDAAATTMPA